MNLDDVAKAVGIFCAGLLGGAIPQFMRLRRQHSTDAAARAHNEASESKSDAEKDYFTTAIGTLTIDRDKWVETANQAWSMLRVSESQVSRYAALQELHERQLFDRDRQITRLWKLVIRFAPENLKEVLSTEFASTQTGDLDPLSTKG